MNVFANRCTITNVNFSVETLLEKIQLVLAFQGECEYGDRITSTLSFGVFVDYQKLEQENKKSLLFRRVLLLMSLFSD